MKKSLCGIDCGQCPMKDECNGCAETNGSPFGGRCILAACDDRCGLKKKLIDCFNALGIKDMPEVTELYALVGSYVNLEYTLPGGKKITFWKDKDVYLGNQLEKVGSDRCYGLTTDGEYLLVCEYGENGSDPEIVDYRRIR